MERRTSIEEFVEDCTEVQREHVLPLLDYMRRKYPEWKEGLSYQMPMFRFKKQYIAFSVATRHFSLHSLDFELIASAKELFPKAEFGKGCVKVSYTEPEPFERLFGICDSIVERYLRSTGKPA
jgi:uncharacterized protein YdhG (YjbR/CyaY superfamily)